MIPKKIHYCWFGGNPLPDDAKKCIESWKRFCPDYEIIEWNEENFDINCNTYVKEAYESKKFAFVTDYVRLYAMCTYGGIYMDTDVEVVKNLDEFLTHRAFSGFESVNSIPTGIMASEPDYDLFKKLLSYYDDKHFINSDGSYNTITNTVTITEMCKEYGLILNNQYQVLNGFALYPNDYFCPVDHETGILKKTKNTAAIHWFAMSWVDEKDRKKARFTRLLHRAFGAKFIHNVAVKLGLRK